MLEAKEIKLKQKCPRPGAGLGRVGQAGTGMSGYDSIMSLLRWMEKCVHNVGGHRGVPSHLTNKIHQTIATGLSTSLMHLFAFSLLGKA